MFGVVIVGAGGFAREVYHWAGNSLPKADYVIKGFISNDADDLDVYDFDAAILGSDESYEIDGNDRFLMAIGNIGIKKNVAEKLKEKGAQFIGLTDKTAIVTATAKLGEGVVICPYVIVSDNVEIGDFAMLNFFSSCGHDSKVGRYGILSPYATLNGFARLEDEVFLGTHATVLAGKTVGQKSKVNANSVAMNYVPQRTFVLGVPGKNRTIF